MTRIFKIAIFSSCLAYTACKQSSQPMESQSTPTRPSEWCRLNDDAARQLKNLTDSLTAQDKVSVQLYQSGEVVYNDEPVDNQTQFDGNPWRDSKKLCDSRLSESFQKQSKDMLIAMGKNDTNKSFALSTNSIEVGNPGSLLMRVTRLPGGNYEVITQGAGGARVFGVIDAKAAQGLSVFLKGV